MYRWLKTLPKFNLSLFFTISFTVLLILWECGETWRVSCCLDRETSAAYFPLSDVPYTIFRHLWITYEPITLLSPMRANLSRTSHQINFVGSLGALHLLLIISVCVSYILIVEMIKKNFLRFELICVDVLYVGYIRKIIIFVALLHQYNIHFFTMTEQIHFFICVGRSLLIIISCWVEPLISRVKSKDFLIPKK